MKKLLNFWCFVYPREEKVGRIRFALTLGVAILVYWVSASILDAHQPNLTAWDNFFYTLLFFLTPLLIVLIFAVTIKRLRAIGEPAWWSVLLILPYINAVLAALLTLMPNRSSAEPHQSRTTRLTLFTTIAAVTPFILYAYQRYMGILPSSADWYTQGNNHGPWRYMAAGFSLYYPVIGALVIALFEGLRSKKTSAQIAFYILLVIVQFVALAAQFYFLGWTID